MKKTAILAATVLFCACGGNHYTIEGTSEGLAGTVYLLDRQQNVIDSTSVGQGAFRFKGRVDEPRICYLSDEKDLRASGFVATLILEPGRLTVSDDAEVPFRKHVVGTPANDANDAYTTASAVLVGEYRDPDTSDERRGAIEKEHDALARTTLAANRDNLFGVLLLSRLSYELPAAELLDEIALLTPEMQQTEMIRDLRTQAEQKARTETGQSYIDIVQPDAAGEILSLRSVIENPANKLTLVDFWASWCGPCMGEVPHLKRAYAQFHDKGFEIYGVSLDSNRDAWLAAIGNKDMGWIHVCDLQGFESPAARDYAVQGIPANFLVDSQGRIVATNLRGEALGETVASLLK